MERWFGRGRGTFEQETKRVREIERNSQPFERLQVEPSSLHAPELTHSDRDHALVTIMRRAQDAVLYGVLGHPLGNLARFFRALLATKLMIDRQREKRGLSF